MNTIIGQDELIGDLERIFEIFKASETEIRPHFILTGPSGSGKTLTISTLAREHNIGFVEINAAQLTIEGTSGNSLSKALSPLRQIGSEPTIVFVDDFDKLFISGNSNSEYAHETTTRVQNEFLKILESAETSVFGDYGKYAQVPAKNLLFVFAGAFNGETDITIDRLREIGVKTEFLGRVGLVYNTEPLRLESLYEIVDNSELLEYYCALFPDQDREIVSHLLKAYIRDNHELNTLGARMINTLIHQYFIKGGLNDDQVKKIVFERTLNFDKKKSP